MFKTISCGSESDSDTLSDSDSEKLALQAFKHMKSKLHQQKKYHSKVRTANPVSNPGHRKGHRKLYDTFVSNSDNEVTDNIQGSENRVSESRTDLFFLDKNAVQLGDDTSNVESLKKKDNETYIDQSQTEIEVTDLSNLNIEQDSISQEVQKDLKIYVSSKNKASKR